MAAKGSGHGSGAGGGQGIHLLPEYDGTRRKGCYREWKRQVLAYQFGYDVEPKMLAPRVWLRLTGEAKDAVDTIDIEDLAKDDGMKKLWTLLDKEFDQDLICAIEEVVEEFWNYRRTPGMDMDTYLTGFKTVRRRMEKEDPDTKISQKAMAVRLLKRSGLNPMERKQVCPPLARFMN